MEKTTSGKESNSKEDISRRKLEKVKFGKKTT
jgi:hypothetical protein